MKSLVLPALLALSLVAPAGRAESGTAPAAAPKAPAVLPGLPWHMINLRWTCPPVEDFNAFSIDVDISQDMPAETYNLYISTICGHINGTMYYGGIQTDCNGWDAMNPGDRKRLHGGHGFIFSRWSDKPDLSVADVRATPGGFVESAGYEGHFVSGRRPYPWKAGKYTFALRKLDTQRVDGTPFTWVGCFVTEHATGNTVFVNALRFPGDKLKHDGRNTAFLEFYATAKNARKPDIAALPPLVVKYSDVRFNGAPADIGKVTTRFIRKAEKRTDGLSAPVSPDIVRVVASDDGREITCSFVNKPYPAGEEPDRTLFEKAKAK